MINQPARTEEDRVSNSLALHHCGAWILAVEHDKLDRYDRRGA
jgi:hypothetical protein